MKQKPIEHKYRRRLRKVIEIKINIYSKNMNEDEVLCVKGLWAPITNKLLKCNSTHIEIILLSPLSTWTGQW